MTATDQVHAGLPAVESTKPKVTLCVLTYGDYRELARQAVESIRRNCPRSEYTLVATASEDEGIFGDHLRRMLVLLVRDQTLTKVVRDILRGKPCPDAASFYRLRSAGVMRGDSFKQVQPRCEIYGEYLRRHLP